MSPSTRTSITLTVCVVALLLLAGLGTAGYGPSTDASTADATQPEPAGDLDLPERVVLDSPQTEGSAVIDADAGAALDRGGSQLDGAYDRYLLDARLQDADTEVERREILRDTVSEMNDSTNRLREREQSARSAYRNGEIDEEAYLARLGSINAEAQQLEAFAQKLDPIDPRTDGILDRYAASSASAELETIRGDILVHRGPVRTQVGESMAADAPAARVHVAASTNGTVLSTITDGEYHREAIRTDLHVSGSERGISLSEAYDLALEELYPRYQSQSATVGWGVNRQFYQMLGEGGPNSEDGILLSYIDAVSRDVFWEYQRMGVDRELSRATAVTNSSSNVTLTVRPTYGTGPASVHVFDEGLMASNASIQVDGVEVATTSDDGSAWVVLPSESPTVTATVDGETTQVSIDWETVYDGADSTDE